MAGDLVLDVGNTRVKMGWFVEGRCVRMGTVDPGDTAAVKQWLAGFTVHRIAIGSVAHDHAWHADLGELGPLVVLRGDMPSPLGSRYTTPGTLGVDRLANAVAAHATFPGRAALAISLGTCVTYDVVTAAGEHLGGAISPGMHLRSRAMHTFSARLPETDLSETVEELGTSTQGALLAGIHHGIAHELHGWVQTLRQQHDGLAVVLTGGDALRFSRALKSGIFADPSLTLRGLHALLSFALLADGVAVGDPGG
jgi:type III pantothenate kinase